MKNTKKWFLVKKDWVDNAELSDEVLGQLIRGLYADAMPKHTIAKVMYTAVKEEYAVVNNYVKDKEKQREERSRKAAQARWGNAKAMPKHTDSNANIGIDKDIDKDIDKGIDRDLDIVWDNIINE